MNKTCTKCGIEKPIGDFHSHKGGRFGKDSVCKGCKSRIAKKWREENREDFRNTIYQWRLNNPDKFKDQISRANTKRRSVGQNRLNSNIRNAMKRGIRSGGKGTSSIFEGLGYTRKDLCEHIESQFSEGMSWDNYGKWHVDHIRPLSSFSYESKDDTEFKIAWSLYNLRPLWASDNIRKGNRYECLFLPIPHC